MRKGRHKMNKHMPRGKKKEVKKEEVATPEETTIIAANCRFCGKELLLRSEKTICEWCKLYDKRMEPGME